MECLGSGIKELPLYFNGSTHIMELDFYVFEAGSQCTVHDTVAQGPVMRVMASHAVLPFAAGALFGGLVLTDVV